MPGSVHLDAQTRRKRSSKKTSKEQRQILGRIRSFLIRSAVHPNERLVSTTVCSVLRRLRTRASTVNAFVKAIHSKHFGSACVPIEKTLDGRSQFGDVKVSAPFHVYSVFRFPDVQKQQFVNMPHCFTDGPDEECINPYHYSHFPTLSSAATASTGEVPSDTDNELCPVLVLEDSEES
uniref:MH1 domain-containing protein n=1 Tax=Steinernema glaseri TaxID=37863 RepID=A0A1I8A2M9_9BILA